MNQTSPTPLAPEHAVELLGIDHVEYWVGNAKQAAYYYKHAFGFQIVGYAGPETGRKGVVSYALQQNDIFFVLTTSLTPEGPIAEHVRLHGDGVRDIVFRVKDVQVAYDKLIKNGATSVMAPTVREDANGRVTLATIATYGDTVHTLINREDYAGPFLPQFEARETPAPVAGGLGRIDHIVGNVGWNEMGKWVDHYAKIFGWHQFVSFDDKDISTDFTALRSVVVANPNEIIKFPINEPAEGKKKSQIEEYIDFYHGPGVQHLALTTADICETVARLKANGVEFLEPPEAYYEHLAERLVGVDFKEDIERLKPLGILVDHDEKGYLLQIFTKPVTDRPTLFYEIIQRKGSDSFGKGNFKALFEAIEAEQGRRGNL